MTLDNVMKGLMQSASGSQQGSDPLSQALGGMTLAPGASAGVGGSQGGNSTDAMLGALERIIGGKPGSGQPLPNNQGMVPNTGGANNPAMSMVQPVANQVAEKAHISPAMATIVAAIAMHYLLASHPSSSQESPLSLGSVMQELQGGGLSPSTMQNSGMVNDVKQATGLNDQQAQSGLGAAFKALASHL